ncbi:MAG: YncE family protein [Desulfobulbaceae bacterium]|nr:YncE family protein [Desulfobulbaceae bacterium]
MPAVHSFFLLLLTTFFCGCTMPQGMPAAYKPPLGEQGELYLYLQPLPQEMLPLSLTISRIEVIPEQGNIVLPILTDPLTISGQEAAGMQKRLAASTLPPGRYTGIVLTIDKAAMSTERGEADLVPPAEPIRLELGFSILREESMALFLQLSHEFLVTEGYRFTPRFVLGKTSMPPRNYLGFISNTNENIVTVFNKRSMEVIQVIHTGAGPKGMALDRRNGLVYVAAAGDGSIEIISTATLGIIGRIRLQFGDEPTELALTPDGRTLLSANFGSGTVSIISTRSMAENDRLFLDPDPAWIVAGRDGGTAYVLHTMSNTISVIDVPGRRLLTSVQLDESPVRGALSSNGDRLYIAAEYSAALLVVDTRSLTVTERIFIGGGSSSVTTDFRNKRVYVGKASGEIVVVNPEAGMFIDSFRASNGARFITIEREENVLLVLSAAGTRVSKLNLVSKRKLAAMDTEDGGHALVVMGEM